ncbi:MAG: protein-glutamate O-methyltransferase CheR [Polyangiaceae bacterium]
MSPFTLSEPLFTIWKRLIEERTGICYDPGDRSLLASKLETRVTDAGFESALDYYYFLRYDPGSAAEFDALVDALVVNETYFFREAEPLRALCETVLLPLCKRGERPRVWCAACASGEEVFTLAMMLDGLGILSKVELVASDIGLKVLARAKEGTYGPRSLRALPPGVMGDSLEMKDGRACVRPRLRETISWRRVNLLDDEAVRALGTFDAILCRNVFIYFSSDTVRRVVATLSSALKETAPLLLGASESILQLGTALRFEERGGSFFYVRSGK